MEKSQIDSFIKKYYLNGTLNQVRWVSKDKTLSTTAMTPDRKFLAQVVLDKFDAFEDVEVGVLDTSTYLKMLNVVGSDVTFNLTRDPDDNSRVTSVTIADAKTESSIVAGDLSVIAESPKMKTIPNPEVEIKLNEDFISRFLKAKNALPDVDLFTLAMNKKRGRLEMVLGFSTSSNINRISLEVETADGKDKVTKPINFSAKILKEILTANPDCKDNILKVSEQGLSFVEFTSGNVSTKYYMIKIDSED
jgi:predicted nucleic acid-binding protein